MDNYWMGYTNSQDLKEGILIDQEQFNSLKSKIRKSIPLKGMEKAYEVGSCNADISTEGLIIIDSKSTSNLENFATCFGLEFDKEKIYNMTGAKALPKIDKPTSN